MGNNEKTKETKEIIDKVKVTLNYPITVRNVEGKEEEITELTLRPIKSSVFKIMPKGGLSAEGGIEPGAMVPLISNSARITLKEAEQIDFRDVPEVTEKMSSFLTPSPQIGKK